MSKVSATVASSQVAQEQAEWHPYKVWAAHVRGDEDQPSAHRPPPALHNNRESWDPFSVWKRQVKR